MAIRKRVRLKRLTASANDYDLASQYFLDGNEKQMTGRCIPADKFVFIKIAEVCKSLKDMIKFLEKIIKDISEKKQIKDSQIIKELKSDIGKILNDSIILEPNIVGIGVNINQIVRYLGKAFGWQ